jgi:hypothetical protein
MHIMFLSHYFPPEVNAPASRTYEHCRLWASAGHEVTVVTCAPNHPHGRVYPGYVNRLFAEETTGDGIRIIRLWTFLAANQGFARRTLNYLSYLAAATLLSWRLPRPDIVVSTSPQFFCGLAGWVVGAVKAVPWVLEIRDLWPESIACCNGSKRWPTGTPSGSFPSPILSCRTSSRMAAVPAGPRSSRTASTSTVSILPCRPISPWRMGCRANS